MKAFYFEGEFVTRAFISAFAGFLYTVLRIITLWQPMSLDDWIDGKEMKTEGKSITQKRLEAWKEF